jgi:hypothetical protein
MKKTIILSAIIILSAAGRSSLHAQGATEATTPDQTEAVGIMLRLGELYHKKAQLGDPKKEFLEGVSRILVSKMFSQRLADNARKLAAQYGGDLGDKFIIDAEAIEADAEAEAKQEGKELNARVGPKIKSATAIEGEVKTLESRFWATQYGQSQDIFWTAQATKDKPMYEIYLTSGRDGLLRWNAGLMYDAYRR